MLLITVILSGFATVLSVWTLDLWATLPLAYCTTMLWIIFSEIRKDGGI